MDVHFIRMLVCPSIGPSIHWSIHTSIHPSIICTLTAWLRNRSALAVNCCVIIHCLEIKSRAPSKSDLSSYNSPRNSELLLHNSCTIELIYFHSNTNNNKKIIWSPAFSTFPHCTEELLPILRLRHIRLHLLYPRKLCLWWVYCFHVVRPSVRNALFP